MFCIYAKLAFVFVFHVKRKQGGKFKSKHSSFRYNVKCYNGRKRILLLL